MALTDIGLATSRWNIRNKSIALMALFPVVVSIASYWQIYFVYVFLHSQKIASTAHPNFGDRVDEVFAICLPFILGALVAWFLYCLRRQDDIIQHLFRANLIDRRDNPDLYNMVETLAIQLGQPLPEIYLIKTFARNAFASTLSDGTDRIYVTTGLLEALAKDEVEAVLAHEYGHILSEDTRWLGLSIIFTNIFGALPAAATKHNKFGNLDEGKVGEGLNIFLLNLIFIPVWLGYAVVSLLRLFLMFQREFHADLMAVEITKNPEALMRALQRIHKRARIPHIPSDVMLLCIDNPRGGFFATHPRLFYRLRKIAGLNNMEIPIMEESSMAPIHKRFTKNKLLERTFRAFKAKNHDV
ncbi:MAG: M48 family metalloprotease [Alphaproteobacteria bacterium]|nr:M48 family metalloprotease [Alphaproteobacteria bacterium]